MATTTKRVGVGKRGSKSQGKKLTAKQQKLVEGIVEGKTQKDAAIAAGYSPKCANEIAYQQLQKDSVKQSLQELMEQHGLDDAALIKKHTDLLHSDSDSTQVKALEMAYKLKGAFVEKHEHTGLVTVNQISIEVVR